MIRIPAGIGQIALVAAVVAAALGVSELLKPRSGGVSGQAVVAAPAPMVTLVQPEQVSVQPALRLTGTVENRTRTDIAAQVGGRVTRVSPQFAPGALVKQGDLLFAVDPVDYELALETTAAEIAAAKSDIERLQIEASLAVREWQEVYPGREPPPLAARVPQLSAANARLMAAEANRRKAELALERTVVRAAASARILQTQLDVGQVINPNQVVGAAYALAGIEISASASTEELEGLEPVVGRRAAFVRSGSSAAGHGTIVRVDGALDPRTRLGRFFIKPDEPDNLIVGQFVEIEIPRDAIEGVVSLPASALSGRDQVWVVADGRLSQRRLTLVADAGADVMVKAFDSAEGVVRIPPAGAREGQVVTISTPANGVRSGEVANVGP